MAKKKSTAKTSKKRSRAKKSTKKPVAQVEYFIRVDGQPIVSLVDLAQQMDTMADEVFYHHVTDNRNDFAAWVSEALNEKELATLIGAIKQRERMCQEIMRALVHRL